MHFYLKPILSEIKEFYQKPISAERFAEYRKMLEGGEKGELNLPIAAYNPMAKDHILTKIKELERIDAEGLMESAITDFNKKLENKTNVKVEVLLNLADDLEGAWTNYYTTDFDSKFKISGLVRRNFCAPHFWTSELYSKALITRRTNSYLYRSLYWQSKPNPKTLEDHLEQEVFVSKNTVNEHRNDSAVSFETMEKFHLEHKNSEEYNLIFNFFYGDEASEKLAFKRYGNSRNAGFEYAKILAMKERSS